MKKFEFTGTAPSVKTEKKTKFSRALISLLRKTYAKLTSRRKKLIPLHQLQLPFDDKPQEVVGEIKLVDAVEAKKPISIEKKTRKKYERVDLTPTQLLILSAINKLIAKGEIITKRKIAKRVYRSEITIKRLWKPFKSIVINHNESVLKSSRQIERRIRNKNANAG